MTKGGIVIIGNDRTQLDAWLEDPNTVLLLLREAENGPKARVVHDFIERTRASGERNYDVDWHEVLITDTSNVTPDERKRWFGDPVSSDYAALKNPGPNTQKSVVRRGPITDLLFPQGDPLYVHIRDAFQE